MWAGVCVRCLGQDTCMSYQHSVLGVERSCSPLTTLSPSEGHCPTGAEAAMCRAAQEGAAFSFRVCIS